MTEHNDRILIDEKLTGMNTRLTKLEVQMTSIDSKLTTVVDAILGNSLTKSGGFIEDIRILKAKIIVLEYLTGLYSNLSGK